MRAHVLFVPPPPSPPLTTPPLPRYFLSQINLYASMCFGRSYNCIGHLQKMFPYPVLLSLIMHDEDKMPNILRCAFVKLMHRLWLDRYPQSPNCGRPGLPDLAWVYSDLEHKKVTEEGSMPAYDLGNHHPLLDDKDEYVRAKRAPKGHLRRKRVVGGLSGGDPLLVKPPELVRTFARLHCTNCRCAHEHPQLMFSLVLASLAGTSACRRTQSSSCSAISSTTTRSRWGGSR